MMKWTENGTDFIVLKWNCRSGYYYWNIVAKIEII